MPQAINLPYFDLLLAALEKGDPVVTEAFGRHVHWGYWPDPAQATKTAADFAVAAERLTQEVCQAAQVSYSQTILDAGCGFGGTIASLNERFTGLKLTGLNIDARQLARARKTVTARENNEIAFVEGDACALPFPDASFDRVLAVECIFHFPSRQKFFQEAFRVLKPGGRLALSDFTPKPFLLPLMELSALLPKQVGFYGGFDLNFTAADYGELAAKTGFKTTMQQDITHNTIPTYDFLLHLGQEQGSQDLSALFQTSVLYGVSYLHLLQYLILGFEKPL